MTFSPYSRYCNVKICTHIPCLIECCSAVITNSVSLVLFQANIISLSAYLLLSLVIVQAHNQHISYRSTTVKATNNGHPNSESKISHSGNIHITKHSGKSHTSSSLTTRGILTKTTPAKTSIVHTISKTTLSSTANAPKRYSTRSSITYKRQDNVQTKSQMRTTNLSTSPSRQSETTNPRSEDPFSALTTVSTTAPTTSTTASTTSTTTSAKLTDSLSSPPESSITLTDSSPTLVNSQTTLNNSISTLNGSSSTLNDSLTTLNASLTTLNASLSNEITTKRQDNGIYVYRKDQGNKMDSLKNEASPTPTYSQKFRYFTFNLDQMIADLANDSDKEVADFFTTTSTSTAAPTTPTIPTLNDESLKNWQHLLPYILNTKAPLYLPPNIPVNIPAKPTTNQSFQLAKHGLSRDLQISSSDSVMDERIKKLEQPKPIVLMFEKNTSQNNFLRDPTQDYSLDMHPLQIRARDTSLDLNDLAVKELVTELPSIFKGRRKKVYQAKLILEELPYEELKTKYNADDADFSNTLTESPHGVLPEISIAMPYSPQKGYSKRIVPSTLGISPKGKNFETRGQTGQLSEAQ
ncbi:hypothetical protein Trydic_g22674 [Trypoxylus dichotomus]